MPTKAEIARHLKVDRSYITRLVQRGMPTDSFPNAKKWKDTHASSRASTSPKQIAKQLAEEENCAGSNAPQRRKGHLNESRNDADLSAVDSLDSALQSIVQAQEEAWRLLHEAILEGKDSKIGVRLAIHNKAVEARLKAAIQHREELERRRILIPLSEAMDTARKGYSVILDRLRSLPQNVAPRCNPANIQHAMSILETECTAIIADAQKAFAS